MTSQSVNKYGTAFPKLENANPILYPVKDKFMRVLPGPPFVKAKIIPYSCIAAISLNMRAIKIKGLRSGNVNVLKVNHGDPPSILADSYGDFGSD